ncbi:hypothetical protein [Lolliginicoccus suaedae]|uniref:hypothetical protein n=1 Tax=Lolliginicoccus suaedae TaxID=2605429 RepID=UPI0011ED0EF5|nr:hypothetical protein [Lolliginicoccus suaedae]
MDDSFIADTWTSEKLAELRANFAGLTDSQRLDEAARAADELLDVLDEAENDGVTGDAVTLLHGMFTAFAVVVADR